MKTIVSEESEEGFFDDKENVYFAASSQSADSPTSCNVKKARGRRVKGFDRRRWFIILYCSYIFWIQCALMVQGYL